MVDGFAPPSKILLKKEPSKTRNYQTRSTHINIAIVTIPVIDIQTVIGVGVANIGNIGANVL